MSGVPQAELVEAYFAMLCAAVQGALGQPSPDPNAIIESGVAATGRASWGLPSCTMPWRHKVRLESSETVWSCHWGNRANASECPGRCMRDVPLGRVRCGCRFKGPKDRGADAGPCAVRCPRGGVRPMGEPVQGSALQEWVLPPGTPEGRRLRLKVEITVERS